MDAELLDLNYLTIGERKHLLSVVDADEEIRVRRFKSLEDNTGTTKHWPPSNGHFTAFQQLQVKLEIDHIYCTELLRKSLIATGFISQEYDERLSVDNVTDRYSSNGTLNDYKGEYEISGQVLVGVYYKDDELHVHVNRASGIAAADCNGSSDPYIKTYLLPDKAKRSKRKTSIQKMTLDPVYNETFKYKPSELDLSSQILWLSVWDWDRFSTNQFLGEIHLPLFSLDLNDTTDHWYQLQDKGGGSQTALQHSSLVSAESSHLEEMRQRLESIYDPSQSTSNIAKQRPVVHERDVSLSHLQAVASDSAKPPAHVAEQNTGRHRTREPHQLTQSTSASTAAASQVATGSRASVNHEDVHIEQHSSATESIAMHTQPLAAQSDAKIHVHVSLAAENQRHMSQSAPQNSSLTRLKQVKGSNLSGSRSLSGSISSIYSEAGSKGDYNITGEVMVGVYYKNGELHVHVDRAQGLAAANNNGYSNPYIKTYLLPDKARHTKKKTSVKKKTLDPVYNETLTYKVSSSELNSRILWLSVWDSEKFGRNQFLGEIHLPLSSLDLSLSTSHWYDLQDKEEFLGSGEIDDFYRGELKVGIKYQPSGGSKAEGTLVVDVKRAKELPPMDVEGTSSVVKLYLLPNRKSSGKRKTGVIKHNLNPVWEEKFTFEDVSLEELSHERVLEISVWSHDRTSHSFIGCLRLGSAPGFGTKQYDWMDSADDEVTHWVDMLRKPGEWVEQWHVLRTTLKPQITTNQRMSTPSFSISRTPSIEDSLGDDESAVSGLGSERGSRFIPVTDHELMDSTEIGTFAEESFTRSPNRSGLLGLKRPDSISSLGSMTSIYSGAGGRGDYDITGEVQVGVHYSNGELHIHVNRAEGLAAAKSNGYSDPYIKTYLLPDKAKHTKKKTAVRKKTLDPVYDETLKYKISESEVSTRTLCLSAWDLDRFGRNQFLGEVCLPLSSVDLSDTTDKWYFMQDTNVESNLDTMYRGQVNIAMQFTPASHSHAKKTREQGTLMITIKQAKDLQEPVDSFVKLYLLPDKSTRGKRKTKTIKSSMKPTWEETFTYEKVQLDELSFQRVLEVTIWNFHKRSENVFIGGLRLGPAPGSAAKHKDWMDSIGEEVSHWEETLAHPGEWVERWHTLRTTMNPRDVMLPP